MAAMSITSFLFVVFTIATHELSVAVATECMLVLASVSLMYAPLGKTFMAIFAFTSIATHLFVIALTSADFYTGLTAICVSSCKLFSIESLKMKVARLTPLLDTER